MAQNFPFSRYAVLVVEDEPLVRMDAVTMVEEAGFTAYEAANADEAIALLERHSDIRFLFTDIEMPGSMDGLKLAHAVRKRWPPVTILVTSGRAGLSSEDLPERGYFFPKPYQPSAILQVLREAAARLS